ncbi:MAG: RHS repeat-associated core domain-containing protein, partial [Proteobacteria bacterium]
METRSGDNVLTYACDQSVPRISRYADVKIAGSWLKGAYISERQVIENIAVNDLTIGLFEPVAMDIRGTVLATVSGSYSSEAYGKRASGQEYSEYLDFAGHGRDTDTGLVRMGVRDYDPKSMHFAQLDQFVMQDTINCLKSPVKCNLYSYAKNNPLNNTDPSGKFVILPAPL